MVLLMSLPDTGPILMIGRYCYDTSQLIKTSRSTARLLASPDAAFGFTETSQQATAARYHEKPERVMERKRGFTCNVGLVLL